MPLTEKYYGSLPGEEETRAKFQYGEEPPAEQYEKDFGSFKTSSMARTELGMLTKLV